MYRFAIFLFFLCIYLFSVGIPFASSDGQVMYETARALGLEGNLNITPMPLPQIVQGKDGLYYSKYDPGLPWLAILPIQAGDRIGKEAGADYYAVSAVFVMVIPAIGMAVAMTALFAFAEKLYNPSHAFIITLVAGLGTTAWPYGTVFFAEAVIAGMITLAFVLLAERKGILLASLAIGIAIFTRASAVIFLPAMLYLLWQQKARRKQFLTVAIFPILALIGLLIHNTLRFGTPLKTGYEGEMFSTWPWIGIGGLLFSPGKSAFLYAPPLLLTLLLWPRFHRKYPAIAKSLALMTLTTLLYYGSWWAWHGGWVWGPRFLVPIMPLWCLAWGELPAKTIWRLTASLIFVIGFGVQIIGTFTDVNQIYAQTFEGTTDTNADSRYAMIHYHPAHSPLVAGFKQAWAGEWEPQAIYNLAGTKLTSDWVNGIPRTIHWTFVTSVMVILVRMNKDARNKIQLWWAGRDGRRDDAGGTYRRHRRARPTGQHRHS